MGGGWRRPGARVLLLGVLVGGCAIFTVDERVSEGPRAEDVWKARFEAANGRAPSFSETQGFEESKDAEVREFLRQNPQVGNAYRAVNLRLSRQAMPGMTKGEIRLLLGPPLSVTDDASRMKVLARQWWPSVRDHAKEAWTYPGGWTLYFDGDALADLTRFHRQFFVSD